MKLNLLIFILFFPAVLVYGQQIQLKSAEVATAGSATNGESVNIPKWRIGQVHLVVFNGSELLPVSDPESASWNVKAYPNPFTENLNLKIASNETKEFSIGITDVSGKKNWLKEKRTVRPGEEVSLDLKFLSPAMYMVILSPVGENVQKVIKVQKQ